MRTYKFWIKRESGSPFELLELTARNAVEALRRIPPCIYWRGVARGDWE